MGDNKVLISFYGKEDKLAFLKSGKDWLSLWFEAVHEWCDREVWVQVIGVPLHAWNEDTFFRLGTLWGEVLATAADLARVLLVMVGSSSRFCSCWPWLCVFPLLS
ncbi:hypothetical protein U1Q18_004658 [Sarracenia purpurea var. burkii]